MKLNLSKIKERQDALNAHPLLNTTVIQNMDDLRTFMKYHVFAVWDFMSLLKSIQHEVVPSGRLWLPTSGTRSEIARTINEIVLCEESDIGQDGSPISHFDLYLQAMMEVGADTSLIREYLAKVEKHGVHWFAPEVVEPFVNTTFDAIYKGPHCAAASFCYGRETAIPAMFKRVLKQTQMSRLNAPKFYYYLERHIEVDGEDHGPMSEKLVEYFCKNDPFLIHEAEQAAIKAIDARIQLFDAIEQQVI